ncbi:hypothetical protein FisN_16Lu081 [Fistulifera solaris]|uniref:HYR domain-containing protein n=1 Tax=Fistulifera solaris TaxID=1519565 RepID=A0A1Z5KJX4_FISSO|nr:hypothetical protein FisN_16Lu081 [Fistulifera solaris]|eukprot:GAX26238.1 hypothetical protein FisN_16Lu081 [Fistulifera solaris]
MKISAIVTSTFLVIAPTWSHEDLGATNAHARSLLTSNPLTNGAALRVDITPVLPVPVGPTCTATTPFQGTADVGNVPGVTYIFVINQGSTDTVLITELKGAFTAMTDEVFGRGSALNGAVVRFGSGASGSAALGDAGAMKSEINLLALSTNPNSNCASALSAANARALTSPAQTVIVLFASNTACTSAPTATTNNANALANLPNKRVIIETIAIGAVGCNGILGGLHRNGGRCNSVSSVTGFNINSVIGTTLKDLFYKFNANPYNLLPSAPMGNLPGPNMKSFSQVIPINLGSNELCVKAMGSDAVGERNLATSSVEVSECIFIAGIDTSAPAMTCPLDISIGTDLDTCSSSVDIGSASAVDNCDFTLDPQPDFSGPFDLGSTSVTFSVSDDSGNAASCSMTVQVNDEQDPTITCPPDITTTTDIDTCTSLVAIGSASAEDNCDIDLDPQPDFVGPFTLGSTSVTFSVSDDSDNTASCIMTVQVSDEQDPTITCPPSIITTTDPDTCTSSVDIGSASAVDNCDIDLDPQPDFSGPFDLGSTSIIFRVDDDSGNFASCSMTVLVNDEQAPTITCPPAIITATDPDICTSSVNIGSASAADNCDSDLNPQPDFVGPFTLGSTSVTFIVDDDSGNSAGCSMTVQVNDEQGPTIICPSSVAATTDLGVCSATIDIGTATATDNCDGILTPQADSTSPFSLGSTSVTFDVSDSSGNAASCSITVQVDDNEAPVLDCPIDLIIGMDAGSCYATVPIPVANVTDNCDQSLTPTNDAANPFSPGSTTITYAVQDAAGNSDTCSTNVIVEDYEKPKASCLLDNAADANVFRVGGSDNCGVASYNVYDLTSKVSFGPYPVGTVFRYIRNKSATPKVDLATIPITITGRGVAQVRATDQAGNMGVSTCNPRSRLLRRN